MEKLKPCPFCGSKNVVSSNEHSYDAIYNYYVECKECGAKGGLAIYSCDKCGPEEAIRAWNRRAKEAVR